MSTTFQLNLANLSLDQDQIIRLKDASVVGKYSLDNNSTITFGHIPNVILDDYKSLTDIELEQDEKSTDDPNPRFIDDMVDILQTNNAYPNDQIDFISDKNTLKNILFCLVFNSDDYVLKNHSFQAFVENKNDSIYLRRDYTFHYHGDYGKSFEKYVTSSDRSINDEKLKGYRVIKFKLGEYTLLTRNEIDCESSNGDVIELKTKKLKPKKNSRPSRIEYYPIQADYYLKWWCQLVLGFGNRLVLGQFTIDDESDCAIVKKLDEFSLSEIQTKSNVNPTRAFAKLHKVLKWIKSKVNPGQRAVISFTGSRNDQILLTLNLNQAATFS